MNTSSVRPEPFGSAQDRPVEGPRHPVADLLSRYKAVFQAAWAHRTELAGPRLMADEAAFLPAALSLQHTPVHPAPRRLAYGLMALFVIALAWAIFGKVDIVALAPGRIIVSERTKVVQPLERSVVKAVLVKDGDHVIAGQPLVALDPTMATADTASVQEQLRAQASELMRTRALLIALQNQEQTIDIRRGARVDSLINDKAKGAEEPALQAQLQSEWQDIRARLANLDAQAARRQAERVTVQSAIAKLEATLPLAQTREADYKNLVTDGFISGHATQDKTRERIELERDLATQRAKLLEAQSAVQEAGQAKAAYLAETRRSLNDRLALASTKHSQLQADAAKASQREKLTTLTAPTAGTVQQLAIHTTGGVVTEAQALMVIVPDEAQVTAEVAIANLDIGFVNPGQVAEVKLETFPFTRYGTVAATVAVVSADAVSDDKPRADGKASASPGAYPSVFSATLTLGQKDLLVDGKRVKLSPGMNITAEIKTGRRRIIDYLLSPVQRAGNESLRER